MLATDVDGEAAERTAAGLGAAAWAATLDVRDPAACRRSARLALERGPLAVWVNNAGVLRTEPIWEHTDEAVELLVAVNLLGTINGSRAAVAAMRPHGGRILNVASLSALSPVPGLGVYSATKHAVHAFSMALQGDLRSAGLPIEVRSLCPDVIDTPMVRERADDDKAAILWSGPGHLGADEVAGRAMELLYGRRLTGAIPAYPGVIARAAGLSPAAGIGILPLLERIGRRRRRRWRRTAA